MSDGTSSNSGVGDEHATLPLSNSTTTSPQLEPAVATTPNINTTNYELLNHAVQEHHTSVASHPVFHPSPTMTLSQQSQQQTTDAAVQQLTSTLQALQHQFGTIASVLSQVVIQLNHLKSSPSLNHSTSTTTNTNHVNNNHNTSSSTSSSPSPSYHHFHPHPHHQHYSSMPMLKPIEVPEEDQEQEREEDRDGDPHREEEKVDVDDEEEEDDDGSSDEDIIVMDGDSMVEGGAHDPNTSNDEEGETQANRAMKQQDDELENEVSETSGKHPEPSMSSAMRIAARRQQRPKRSIIHKVDASGKPPLPTTTTANLSNSSSVNSIASSNVSIGPMTATPGQAWSANGSSAADSTAALLQQMNLHRATQSMSAMPSSSAIPIPSAQSPSASTLVPFFRHFAAPAGTSPASASILGSSIAASSIPPSSTALPLDASPTHAQTARAAFPIATIPPARALSPGGRPHAMSVSIPHPHHSSHQRAQSQSITSETLSDLHSQNIFLHSENKIKLNVGGQLFCTTLTTLLREPNSMFQGMFSGHFSLGHDESGGNMREAIFIDRDPTMFRHVLNYLRDGSICLDGMTSVQKKALIKEARYFGLAGLLALLQLDSRAVKTAQRRELSSEKEYKIVEDVPQKDIAATIKSYTMMDSYEFESWLNSTTIQVPEKKPKKGEPIQGCVHLLFSKKLSRGELMLLDRLQNHM